MECLSAVTPAAMAKWLNMTGTRSSSCIADAGGQLDLNFSLSLLRHRLGKVTVHAPYIVM